MIYQREIQLQTSQHGQMHDLTDSIAQVVGESRVRSGLVNIFNVGSTGAIGTIEFEPGLQQDLPAMLDKLMPPSRDYGHERAWHDGNGHSHLQATMLGPSLTVPVKDANWSWARGSRFFIWSATSNRAAAPSPSRFWGKAKTVASTFLVESEWRPGCHAAPIKDAGELTNDETIMTKE